MVVELSPSLEIDARQIATSGRRTVLDLAEALTTDFECDVLEGCDPELVSRLIAKGCMIFARMIQVKSDRTEVGPDFEEVSFNLAKALLNARSRVESSDAELAELATCFFIFCTPERQSDLEIQDAFFASAMCALREADGDENETPSILAAKILNSKETFETLLQFGSAMRYRREKRADQLTDCVFSHLLNRQSMSLERRRAFILLFYSWLPNDVEGIGLFVVRRMLWSICIPQALQMAMLAYCAPIEEYQVLVQAFALDFHPEVRAAMCLKLREPVRIYLDALYAKA